MLLTAFGLGYVPGDFAARLAAEGLPEDREIVVAYSSRGHHVGGNAAHHRQSCRRRSSRRGAARAEAVREDDAHDASRSASARSSSVRGTSR